MIEELWESETVKKLENDIESYSVNENNIEEYGGAEELQLVKKKKLDKDRCSYTWEKLYIQYYKDRPFWDGTNFDEYKLDYNISYRNLTCRISGDVLFNFKSEEDGATGKGKKYEHYQGLLEKEPDFSKNEKEYYLEILKFCNKMNYTLHNMGLMPVDGNLQKFKETKCNWDRMDRFVYFIAEYLEGNDHLVLTSNYRDKENQDVYKYCEEMYLITDRKYIDDLKEFGEQKIIRGKDVVRYMELAIRYWIMKDKIFSQNHILEEGGVSN